MSRRMRMLAAFLLAWGAIVAALPACAAGRPLPLELELPVAPVEIELDDCWIDVRLEADVVPSLKARVTPGAEPGPAPTLEAGESGGRFRIARVESGDAAALPTLSLELVLDRTQALTVRGSRLGLAVRDAAGPSQTTPAAAPGQEPAGSEPSQPAGTVGHRYELVDSEVQLWGAPGISVTAENTVLYGDSGVGSVVAVLTLGSLTLRGQQGVLQLNSTDSECAVEDLEGNIVYRLTGGSLDVRGGEGRLEGTTDGGMVSATGWRGNVSVSGSEATVVLRDGSRGQARITVEDSDVTLDAMNASLVIELNGGQLSADGLSGSAKIAGTRSSRLVVQDSDGQLDLTLRGESSGEVSEATGTVTAALFESSLEIANTRELSLSADDSRVTAAGIRRLTKLSARRSEVELDLRDASDRSLSLKVPDDVVYSVHLPTPCRVQLHGGSGTSQGVDVTGCELQLEHMGRWKGAGVRDMDGRRPFLLTATLAPTGQLRVRGG
ncbi:MAG TPA: hypothetical protein PLS95_06895 [Thermoanaerobaculales bacterium]|nr:hypothetical protein [Thermoanaerobaculales bacterium]HQN94908.1 hypothetical protein [Thermoanaerobaculales bacterium]HQP42585.1 hypothetical protein [Thermoanaerobaculales bacterium]